jgi:hypothetical protein
MTAQEILLDALKYYGIEVLSVNHNHVQLRGNLEVEVEANGLYKLLDDGCIVAPFNDINELCRFILM